MKERVDDTIHIRPSLGSVQEAQYEADNMPFNSRTHIVMISANNFLIISHDKEHQCFICTQAEHAGVAEKYIT